MGVGDNYTPSFQVIPENTLNNKIQLKAVAGDSVRIEGNSLIADDTGISTIEAFSTDGNDASCEFTVIVFNQKPSERQIQLLKCLNDFEGYSELDVCQKFVRSVYEQAFDVESAIAGTAKEAMNNWMIEEILTLQDDSSIPAGAVIYADCGDYGHVGYYDGLGYVIHQDKGQKLRTKFDDFVQYYHACGWGWQNGDNLIQ